MFSRRTSSRYLGYISTGKGAGLYYNIFKCIQYTYLAILLVPFLFDVDVAQLLSVCS